MHARHINSLVGMGNVKGEQTAHQVSRAASRGAWRSRRPTSAELPLGGALHISAAPASRGAPGPSARYLHLSRNLGFRFLVLTSVSCHILRRLCLLGRT